MGAARTREAVQAMLDFRWNVLIRPRLEGLSDKEYLWEPAARTLSVRPDGAGGFTLDPVREGQIPLGNIAWRMAHLAFSLAAHPVAAVAFGADWPAPHLHAPAGTAVEALARLDAAFAHWRATVERQSDQDLRRRLGAAAAPYDQASVLDIVLHIDAETLQRGADLCLLRDLYAHLGHG